MGGQLLAAANQGHRFGQAIIILGWTRHLPASACLRSNFWPLHYGNYFTPHKKHQQTHLFQRIKFLIEFLLRRRKARSWCRFQRKLFSPGEFSHRAIILFNSQQYWNKKSCWFCLLLWNHIFWKQVSWLSRLCKIFWTRCLGALRAFTSSWRPFRALDFVICVLRALRPCDPRHSNWIVC